MSKNMDVLRVPRKTNEYALAAAAGFGAVQMFNNRRNKRRRIEAENIAGLDRVTGLSTGLVAVNTFNAMQKAYRIRKKAEGERLSSDKIPTPLEDDHVMLFLDIDDFGKFNKRRGHNYGNKVLKRVADRLMGSTRKNDLNFRWGGEELGSILTHITLEDALTVAEKVRDSIQSTGEVTASIGIASLNLDHPIEHSIELADRAMRDAKANGKNCVVMHSPDVHGFPTDT